MATAPGGQGSHTSASTAVIAAILHTGVIPWAFRAAATEVTARNAAAAAVVVVVAAATAAAVAVPSSWSYYYYFERRTSSALSLP